MTRLCRPAAAAQKLPISDPQGGAVSCPSDDASADLVALGYAGGRTVDLWVEPGGWATVANGFILADGSVPLPQP